MHISQTDRKFFSGVQVKKTRRGKRAGRNLKDRPSFEGRRVSTDRRRISVEGRPSFEMPMGPIDGRASIDSQRPSFELQVQIITNSSSSRQSCDRASGPVSVTAQTLLVSRQVSHVRRCLLIDLQWRMPCCTAVGDGGCALPKVTRV